MKDTFNRKRHILYLTRNGLLEPLGNSQVMSYLRGLAKFYKITLITFEKDHDLKKKEAMYNAKTECLKHGIRWLPQRFRYSPKNIAPLISLLQMYLLVRQEIRKEKINLIHARSYIPALVALFVKKITGMPFIFDMRAIWPEELITAGRISRGSLTHLVILKIEKACLLNSNWVVSLTNVGVDYLKSKYHKKLDNQRFSVIPTCVDLKRFYPYEGERSNSLLHGCIGTILSGWFRLDWLKSWIHMAALSDPNSNFKIITRDDAKIIRLKIDPYNQLDNKLFISSMHFEEMPNAMRMHSFSVMFFTDGLSKIGSSPTRLAEALGCGIPVVANEGVGDLADIIKKNNIGVVVKSQSDEHMKNAFNELKTLLLDPELSKRCYTVAKDIFSLKLGTNAYNKIYSEILEMKKT